MLRSATLSTRPPNARREIFGLFALTLVLMVSLLGLVGDKRFLGRAVPAIHQRLNNELLEAGTKGNANRIEDLLAWGADVDCRGVFRQTPLFRAAGQRHFTAVQVLLNRGANPNAVSEGGITPMGWAVDQWRNPQIVKMMLEHGGDPNTEATPTGKASLLAAVLWRNSAITKLLLDAGARPNPHDKDGRTPLLEAVANQDILAVKSLLAKCADPNATSKQGAVPLLAALSTHRRNGDGWSCPKNCVHERMFRLMMRHGGNITASTKNDRPPMLVAASSGDERFVREFFKAGADINGRDSQGNTPLMFAPDHLVPLLLSLGADPTLKCYQGFTAEQKALVQGRRTKAKLIARAVAARKH